MASVADDLARAGFGQREGEPLRLAIARFQRSRGLSPTGDIDPVTGSRLIEAGWHLGDRLLYLTTPLLRGDDVASLQDRLSVLGFDTGRVDGIFGPLTQHAVASFQSECGLAATGELTRATLVELERLAPLQPNRTTVAEARDLAELHREPPSATIAVWGDTTLCTLAEDVLRGTFPVTRLTGDAHDAAQVANRLQPGFVIAFDTDPHTHGYSLAYYESLRYRSATGFHLAELVRDGLTAPTPVTMVGLSVPILRETTAAALLIHAHQGESSTYTDLIEAIDRALREVIHR